MKDNFIWVKFPIELGFIINDPKELQVRTILTNHFLNQGEDVMNFFFGLSKLSFSRWKNKSKLS